MMPPRIAGVSIADMGTGHIGFGLYHRRGRSLLSDRVMAIPVITAVTMPIPVNTVDTTGHMDTGTGTTDTEIGRMDTGTEIAADGKSPSLQKSHSRKLWDFYVLSPVHTKAGHMPAKR